MYADTITGSIRSAVEETRRRREIQQRFNEEHGIEPKTVRKAVSDIMQYLSEGDEADAGKTAGDLEQDLADMPAAELLRLISALEESMATASEEMDFENAALLRDQIVKLRAFLEGADESSVLAGLRAKARKGSRHGVSRKRK